MARARRSEQDYRRILERQAKSGLSIRAFAEESGIPAGTLSWWKSELRRRDRDMDAERPETVGDASTPISFVPIGLVPEDGAEASRPDSTIEVALPSGVTVRVSGEVVEESLLRVLRAVVSTC